jgi:hypothetical protein
MNTPQTFQGLQFRIMETLEKQPNGAPLTAQEIASILHGGEYRNQPKDDLIFKVTRATVGMANTGKLLVAEARDKDGRRCYQLPMRMGFPKPPTEQAPANPVLTPEIAAQVKTVTPKEPPKRAPIMVPGIYDLIVKTIGESPHPLTTADLADKLGHLYQGRYKDKDLRTIFASHTYYLALKMRKIFRRKVTGYGIGVRYVYYTKKTGGEPHPAELKSGHPVEKVAKQEKATKTVTPPNVAHAVKVVEAVNPAKRTTGGFRPMRPELNDVDLKFRVPAAWNNRVVAAANASGLSISEFVRQAIDYAMAHLEAE